MRHRVLYLCCLLPFLLPLLASCERAPTEPEEVFDPRGSLSFAYRGAATGAYQAEGEIRLESSGLPQFGTGASAFRRDSLFALVAFRGEAAPRGDFFTLLLGEVMEPGTLTFDPLACQQQDLSRCRVGVFGLDIDPGEFDEMADLTQLAEQAFVLLFGSVTITHLTKLRVRGTFQGSGLRGNQPGQQNVITITDGVFDLPIQP